MVTKVWTLDLEDGRHTVELEHGYFSGKRVICVDGRPLEKSQKLFDTGSDHQLRIGSHSVVVHIGTNGVSYNYDLILDGRSLKTGNDVSPGVPIPAWAWIFIAGCALIPILTLGGAVPAAIGAGGAVGCVGVSRNSSKDTTTRVLLCALITGVAWAIFLIFLIVIGRLVTRT